MCQGIANKYISLSLSQRDPGKLNHSRWLTTANRILRLYVSIEHPTHNLKVLAEYVMKVYASMWFKIKSQPWCQYGSVHFYNIVTKSRFLTEDFKKVIDLTLQRNAYYAHPENILLAMLADDRKHVRELGLKRILKLRQENEAPNNIREFRTPKLNFEAVSLSNYEIQSLILDVPRYSDLFNFPCHSQAVERCVKIVTEASGAVCGTEARDGFIRARIASRVSLPRFETKSQYKPLLNQ